MASLSIDSKGFHTVQFTDGNRRRKSIRLGKCSKRIAETARVRIGMICSAKKSGDALDGETARYIAGLSPEWAKKFAAAGLIAARGSAFLGAFLRELIDQRKDLKPSSIKTYEQTRAKLIEHFGERRDMRTITEGDADDWRQVMVNETYAEATISKRIKIARQFFKKAFRKKLIDSNPFLDTRSGSQVNESRCHFITPATFEKVLAACPDAERRLILALSRFGGLRCPSETLLLRLDDVDWDAGRIVVTSPKTEHQGKPWRIIPLFPELRPYLEVVFNAAAEGQVYFIQRYRDHEKHNLRSMLRRIIKRAGVEIWPRLYHNLRASRIMELADNFPGKVVSDWMGNTEKISEAHYQKATDQHFDRASESETVLQKSALQKAVQSALQNAVRSMSATSGQMSEETEKPQENPVICTVLSLDGMNSPNATFHPLGTEPRRS